jgi:hypothetical protein
MSGFWSAMPMVSAADDAAQSEASSTTSGGGEAASRQGYYPGSLNAHQDGVLVRVGRAAAQQDERLVAGVDQAVDAGRDDDAVAGPTSRSSSPSVIARWPAVKKYSSSVTRW